MANLKSKGTRIAQNGFTSIELIAVLIIIGILAAFAIPRYIDLQNTARIVVARMQLAETKNILYAALYSHLLRKGRVPESGEALVEYANSVKAGCCPTSVTEIEGQQEFTDFTVFCTGNSTKKEASITITQVQGVVFTPPVTGTLVF